MVSFKKRFVRTCAAVALLSGLAACGNDSAVVWQAQATSPDGSKKVVAKTEQFSGPGTAAVYTTVSVARSDGGGEPVNVLVLRNPNAKPVSALEVQMVWRDSGHLDLTFDKSAKRTFEAVLYGEVVISSSQR